MRAALLAGAALLALGVPALAQSGDLPWKDANPLEGSGQKKAPPRKKAETAPAVPKPEERPKGEAEATKPAPAAAVPLPEAAPAERPEDKGAEVPQAAEPAAQPAPPGDEVPKPEARPQPPEDEPAPKNDTPPPKGETPPLPAEAPAPVPAEPPAPEEAPNSTEKLKSREPVIDPATAVVAAAAIEDAEACEAELKRRGVRFSVGESISEGECGVLRPVAIERLSSGVEVSPKTQVLCRTALALDVWMSDSVVPAAKANFPDEKVKTFQQASTYVCRPRASETGISEHARGSAIDIGGFVFDKGRAIGVKAEAPDTPEEKFLMAIRGGACGPFKTVLGPGTDADHETHFHLDVAARRNGSTYCK